MQGTGSGGPRDRRFRILKVGGARRAFSLEPIFWEALEEMARLRKQRLGQLLGSVLTDSLPSNASSALRTAACRWLLEQYRLLSTRDIRRMAQSVVDSIAAPALVLNQRKQIVAFNRSFRDLGVTASPNSPPAIAQLKLGAPLDRIIEMLQQQPSRLLSVNGVIDFGVARSSGSINVALLEAVGTTTYVLCTVRGLSPAA